MMDTLYNIWGKVRRAAQFLWRHFLTLGILGILFSAFIEGRLNWKNAFYMVSACIFLDWVKQFGKFKLNSRLPYSVCNDISLPLYKRQPWNPGIMGTSAYARDNDPRIKYD